MKNTSKKVQKALKDLEENHQHSIWKEICKRNKRHPKKIALLYRDNKISYGDLEQQVNHYARCLKKMGFKKESIIPLCMKMSPEFIYMFLAISKIGAVMNSVGEWFESGYLVDILNETNSNYFFITCNYYEELKDVIETCEISKIVVFSLDISLKDKIDPYEEMDEDYVDFHKNVENDEHIITYEDFISLGLNYSDEEEDEPNISLDDDFTITYTSGTMNPDKPKAVLHPIRSYMTLSRFKDADISGLGTMKNLTVLAHFPCYVHAGITTSVTDPLFRSCTIALEPIYEKNFFIHSVMMNKPNFVCAGIGFWMELSKKLMFNPKYENIKLPYLYIATVTGEAMSKGEEHFLNKVANKHKFGTAKLPFPLSPIKFSIGGGTSESSGVLVTLYKELQEKRPYYLLGKRSIGLMPLGCCEVKVVDKQGKKCKCGEIGDILLSGPCSMKGYYNNADFTLGSVIKKEFGKKWLKMGAYGSVDLKGTLMIHGRRGDFVVLENGEEYPLFKIEELLEQVRQVMSCTVVQTEDDLVIHVEPQPDENIEKEVFLGEIAKRIYKKCPKEIIEMIYLRFRDNEESFPVAPSGKRDRKALVDEGIEEALRLKDVFQEIKKTDESKKGCGKMKENKRKYHNRRFLYIPVLASVVIAFLDIVILFLMGFKIENFADNETVMSSLESNGLAIISIAVSVWIGINIYNILERREVDEVYNQIQEFEEKIKNSNKQKFLNQIYVLNDISNNYFAVLFEQEKEMDSNRYLDLISIEIFLERCYEAHYNPSSKKENIIIWAKAGLKRIEQYKNKYEMKLSELEESYIIYRIGDFYFYMGYCLEDEEQVNAFRRAGLNFEKVAVVNNFLNIRKSNHGIKVELPFETDEKMGIYFANAIGECYQKKSDAYRKMKDDINCLKNIEIARQYMQIVESVLKRNNQLEREIYYRNYGCALENQSTQELEKAEELFKKAFKCNKNRDKIYHSIISNKFKIIMQNNEIPKRNASAEREKNILEYKIRDEKSKSRINEMKLYLEIALKLFPNNPNFYAFSIYEKIFEINSDKRILDEDVIQELKMNSDMIELLNGKGLGVAAIAEVGDIEKYFVNKYSIEMDVACTK